MTWKEFKASVEQQQLDDQMEVGWINWNSPEPTKTNKDCMPHVVFINDYEVCIGERDKMEGE